MQNYYTDSNVVNAKDKNLYQLVFVAAIPNYFTGYCKYTLYLYCKALLIILPIDVSRIWGKTVNAVATAKGLGPSNIYDVIRKVVFNLNGAITKVIIYLYSNNLYYVYLRVNSGDSHYDIDIKLPDAILLALITGAEIYVTKDILTVHGILLTKEVIKRAISNIP